MGVSTAPEDSSAPIINATNVFYMLLVPAVILWYIYWKISMRHIEKLAALIPGPKPLPFIGNIFEMIGRPHVIFKTINDKSREFGNVIRLWIGSRLLVFLLHPDDAEIILSSSVYIDKSREYRAFEPWLGNGLLISTGQKWRTHRKLIAPTFHLNVLKSFIDLFNSNSKTLIDRLKKEGAKTFDCHDYMAESTVEILLETAMGVTKAASGKSGYEYAMAVMRMCDILHLRHTKFWFRPDFLFNLSSYAKEQKKLLSVIHGLTKRVIEQKKEAFAKGLRSSLAALMLEKKPEEKEQPKKEVKVENKDKTTIEGLSYGQSAGLKDDLDVEENDIGEKKRLAFLDLLLESSQNGVVINDTEIKEQVDTIMFEGHDTTAAGSSFFLSMMGIHQNIQTKVIEELDNIFGNSDRPATFQDTLEMKYLERCLMETLRLYPPVPAIARELKEDLKIKTKGFVIPAGTTVVITTFRIHRNPEFYPNPEVFDPDNFLPEKCANRHYYAFVPFSAGPRSCVGRKYAMLKLKILLSTILRNFRVHSDVKEEDFMLQGDIILKRAEGFKIRLEPRKPMAKASA